MANHHFLLKHRVGSRPHGGEMDSPIIYADGYSVEPIKRRRTLGKQD